MAAPAPRDTEACGQDSPRPLDDSGAPVHYRTAMSVLGARLGPASVASVPRRSSIGDLSVTRTSTTPGQPHARTIRRPRWQRPYPVNTAPLHRPPPPIERPCTRARSPDRRSAYWLFKDTRAAWLWLPLRLYLGWSWLQHGLEKVTNPAWTQSGEALAGFWGNAVSTDPKPVITVSWYREFIEAMLGVQAYTWFADLIVYGEILVGIALILGAFTGIAAFFGAFMNWNYIMAGSASTNGLLLVIAVGVMLAWKVSGWIGLDRWLLPLLGTPWRPGTLFTGRGHHEELRAPESERDGVRVI